MLDGIVAGFPAAVSGGMTGMLTALRTNLGSMLDGFSQQPSATARFESAANDNATHCNPIMKVENVGLLDRLTGARQAEGTLCITATHLIFIDPTCSKECWVPHSHVLSVEKLPPVSYGTPLRIKCKTFHVLTLVIPRERDCIDVAMAVSKLAQPERIEDLFAFSFSRPDGGSAKSFGWGMYDLRSEFLRMGVPNQNWSLCDLNKDYELCDTYPSVIFVPVLATTHVLVGSSKFRSRGRLPVLSYLHRDNQAALCRCSQPLAGFSARCFEDEQMLQAILRANPNSDALVVVDTRPKINALANRAAGKGYENDRVYMNIKFHFIGIENVHVMRNSLQKLVECTDTSSTTASSFLNAVEASGWLKHIRAIVETSVFIASNLESNNSVLVHCSDGWDRTAQTCSLATILLDPYYRTVKGFQAVIEKEWLGFGHKFTDRCRLIASVDSKEESPVFTQFLEAVWHLTNQFPCAFEFNERFLLELHAHVFSCENGTFIGNCEKDRKDLRLSERTYSLWAYVAGNIDRFINPFYRKEYETEHVILRPNVGPQCFRYWKGMYSRFDAAVHERESPVAIATSMREQNAVLESHVQLLEKRAQEMARALGRPVIDALSHKLQGLLSAESISCLAALVVNDDSSKSDSVGTAPPLHHKRARPLRRRPDNGSMLSAEGDDDDTESGFEDGVSPQLSRSLLLDSDVTQAAAAVPAPEVANECAGGVAVNDDDGDATKLTLDCINNEVSTVALAWSSLRNKLQCSNCSLPFDYGSIKRHCRRCGQVFCGSCTDRRLSLAGLGQGQAIVPVCKSCFKEASLAISRQPCCSTVAPDSGGGGEGIK